MTMQNTEKNPINYHRCGPSQTQLSEHKLSFEIGYLNFTQLFYFKINRPSNHVSGKNYYNS